LSQRKHEEARSVRVMGVEEKEVVSEYLNEIIEIGAGGKVGVYTSAVTTLFYTAFIPS